MKDKREQAVKLLNEWAAEDKENRAVLLTAIDAKTGDCTNALLGAISVVFSGVVFGTRNAKQIREAYKAIGDALADLDKEIQSVLEPSKGSKHAASGIKKVS